MLIRFCLPLTSKSASAYDELRFSNVLTLPSRRTLRNYKNAIKPHAGFNPEVINDLIKTTNPLQGCQRNVVLSFDEMKIQEDLVYAKYTGNRVGYVDLGIPSINYPSFENPDGLASHVMFIYTRGLALATRGMLSYQIMGRFWRAVCMLEDTRDLYVIAAVSDGTSSNRSFYKMHRHLSRSESEVLYYAGYWGRTAWGRIVWAAVLPGGRIFWGRIFWGEKSKVLKIEYPRLQETGPLVGKSLTSLKIALFL